jgi:hypothetical protein
MREGRGQARPRAVGGRGAGRIEVGVCAGERRLGGKEPCGGPGGGRAQGIESSDDWARSGGLRGIDRNVDGQGRL